MKFMRYTKDILISDKISPIKRRFAHYGNYFMLSFYFIANQESNKIMQ